MTHLDLTDPAVEIADLRISGTPEGIADQHRSYQIKKDLEDKLGVEIRSSAHNGDIRLSQEEKGWLSQIEELVGETIPFWLVLAGGNMDLTIRWWKTDRYQAIIDSFKNKIQFVQVGDLADYHPPLTGVIDLRDKTTIRQLIRLIYHAEGLLCPPGLLPALAAAIELKEPLRKERVCIVVAGGREPLTCAYPGHAFVHTNSLMPCSSPNGCGKLRTVSLGDHTEKDDPRNLCSRVVNGLPYCMELIQVSEVERIIATKFAKQDVLTYLTPAQAITAASLVAFGNSVLWDYQTLENYVHQKASEKFLKALPHSATTSSRKGIIICVKVCGDLPNAKCLIQRLRAVGCRLPVQLWVAGDADLYSTEFWEPLDVEYVALKDTLRSSIPRKCQVSYLQLYAILSSSLTEVLVLVPKTIIHDNPEELFHSRTYIEHGAVFWEGEAISKPGRQFWNAFGVTNLCKAGFKDTQYMVNKSRCWEAINLAWWYSEHRYCCSEHAPEEREILQLAFVRCGTNYFFQTPLKQVNKGVYITSGEPDEE